MMFADECSSNYPGPAPRRSLHWTCLRAAVFPKEDHDFPMSPSQVREPMADDDGWIAEESGSRHESLFAGHVLPILKFRPPLARWFTARPPWRAGRKGTLRRWQQFFMPVSYARG